MGFKPSNYSKAAQLGIIIGAVLIFFGLVRLSEMFFGATWWGVVQNAIGTLLSYAWPVALIAAGVYVVWAARTGKFKSVSFDASRPLRRSVNDKRIAGVCGGIAEYFRIDPSVVRILALILLIISPAFMLIAYLVAAVLVPRA